MTGLAWLKALRALALPTDVYHHFAVWPRRKGFGLEEGLTLEDVTELWADSPRYERECLVNRLFHVGYSVLPSTPDGFYAAYPAALVLATMEEITHD